MVELPVFNGKKKNFMIWWIRFQSYSSMIGFNSELKKSVEFPRSLKEMNKLNSSLFSKKNRILAVKRNELAMTHVIIVMSNYAMRNKVKTIANSSWPGDLACEIIEKLNE